MSPYACDYKESDFQVEGAHGTVAPQADETFYDDRSDASDDEGKGLKFPTRLYGRSRELQVLFLVYNELASAKRQDVADCSQSCSEGNLASASAGEATLVRAMSGSTVLDLERGYSASSTTSCSYRHSRVVFLSGYSGIGKSALVAEFLQQNQCKGKSIKEMAIHGSGKYTQAAAEPFSGMSQVLAQLVSEVTCDDANEDTKKKVRGQIDTSELLGPGSEGNLVLRVIFPALVPLLGELSDSSMGVYESSSNTNVIKECTLALLNIICDSIDCPLVFFLDDLQWGDGASFDLLLFCLLSTRLKNIMFICSYRENEVNAEHAFAKLMNKVKAKRGIDEFSGSVEQLNLFSLSPDTIDHFIADSIKRKEILEVSELSEVVYNKTMGNIFCVKQALEELVRKNVLFYDMMCFEWRWVASKLEIEDGVSDDVLDSIKGKMKSLSSDIQTMLIVMAYIPTNALEVSILRDLMSQGNKIYTPPQVQDLQHEASAEGMLMYSKKNKLYIFAHDKIRQASHEVVSAEERDKHRRRISEVMLERANSGSLEWCLFVAVDLLNALPAEKKSPVDLIKLNVRVATLAKSRGSLQLENHLLNVAKKLLESSRGRTNWDDYKLYLDLCNSLIVSENSLGNFNEAGEVINEVLLNAKTLDDKSIAYLHELYKYAINSDYAEGLKRGVIIINKYGFNLPTNMSLSKSYMIKEEMKLKLNLRHGSYSGLAELPDKKLPVMAIFQCVAKYAMFSSMDAYSKLLSWKAIQLSVKNGMDEYFPRVLSMLSIAYAKEGKVKAANEVANVCLILAKRIEKNKELYSMTQFVVFAVSLCQLQPFRLFVEPLLQCHKDLKLVGCTEPSLGSALNYAYSYIAAGYELGPQFESTLLLFEDYCQQSERVTFLNTFKLIRQFALNVRQSQDEPTEFQGGAFHEEEILSNMPERSRFSAFRDSSIFRLILGFLFWDQECMKLMLDRLKDYPLKDQSISRLHIRLCFVGLAAFALKKTELGEKCLDYFTRLSKCGSINARPVQLFILAMKRSSKEAFGEAIEACAEAKFVQLEAMAKERFAVFLKGQGEDVADDYMASAYWLYQDWGALAKAVDMSNQHPFLKEISREKAKSLTLSASRDSSKCSGRAHKRPNMVSNFDTPTSSRSAAHAGTERTGAFVVREEINLSRSYSARPMGHQRISIRIPRLKTKGNKRHTEHSS